MALGFELSALTAHSSQLMFTTLHLILAHFLADFPFQPRTLVAYKKKRFLGVILHSLTHFVTSAVLLFPFLEMKKVWIGLLLVFVQHNFFDTLKIRIQKANPKMNKFGLYLLDQAAHLLTISIISIYYLGELALPAENGLVHYTDTSIISYILVLTLSTYFYDVTRWTLLSSRKSIAYKRDYGMMARNAIIVTIAFGLYWLSR